MSLPSTGNPIIDGILLALAAIGVLAGVWKDGLVKNLRVQLKDVSELLEKATSELQESREQNADLRRRLHERDIEIAQMQGRTDFEPVRMMLKELVTSNAIMAANHQALTDKLTISIKLQSDVNTSVSELIQEMRKSENKELASIPFDATMKQKA